MNINIKGITEYDLLKLAKSGVEAEIKDRCRFIADNSASHGSNRSVYRHGCRHIYRI